MAVNKTKKDKPSWMKTGKSAKDTMHKEDAAEQKRKEEQGKLWRFWMPEGNQTSITFLDGHLDDDGVLDMLMYYEHQVFMNGRWTNWFVCTAEEEPCPICEGGNNRSLVGALTVIDHTEFTTNSGEHKKDVRRLFVPKRQTIKQLQMIAAKRGGLAGATFDVMRTGDKSPGCGSVFDFTEKRSFAELKKLYPEAKDGIANYGEEITYMPADKLRELGFGSTPVGGEEASDSASYDEDL